MTDRDALNKIEWCGAYMVDGIGYNKREDNDSMPMKRIACQSNRCHGAHSLQAIAKCYMLNGQKGVVCRCHTCGNMKVFHVNAFSERKPVHLSSYTYSSERIERRLMEMKGVDKEDIDAKCEFMKDEFAKKDRAHKIEQRNFEASIHKRVEDERREREASSFKARLDAGEIKFDKTARAFYEVATGRVVKKL